MSYEGREVGFWSYSWPTEQETTMRYTLDPTVVQASMDIPADVLARASTRCLEGSNGRSVNRWMMGQQQNEVEDGTPG